MLRIVNRINHNINILFISYVYILEDLKQDNFYGVSKLSAMEFLLKYR